MIKSIAELIEMKQKIDRDKNDVKIFYSESLDSNVKFKLATRVETVQVRKMEDEDIDPYLIYSHVIEPNLSDTQLQETFNNGCEPFKIVDKLFSMQEVGDLSLAIIGDKRIELVKDIKN